VLSQDQLLNDARSVLSFESLKFEILQVVHWMFAINHAERDVGYIFFKQWVAQWCGSDRGMTFFVLFSSRRLSWQFFLLCSQSFVEFENWQDQLRMSKIGRSFIKQMLNQCSLLLPFCDDSARDRYFENVRLLYYLMRMWGRKYRNIPESHVTSHCVLLHGIESDHGQARR